MGLAIYIGLQIYAVGYTIYVLTHWRELRERNKGKKDSPKQIIVLLLLIPALAYGYQALKGYPLGPNQRAEMYFMAGAMYAVLFMRWIRQSRRARARESSDSVTPREAQYWYRCLLYTSPSP